MGFGTKVTKSQAQTNSDKGYRTVGSMWKSKKFDGYNILVDKSNKAYKTKGQLIYRDLSTGELFKVKSISCYEPKKPVSGLVFNLVINLNNEYHVETLTDNDVAAEAPDPGTGSQDKYESGEAYPDENSDDSEL